MTRGFEPYIQRLETRLTQHFDDPGEIPPRLSSAMRYAVMAGGKRIRPLLVYLAAEAFGAPLSSADNTACAFELIHCYSLIHDDLPAMDDDDLRRGQATVHKKFDEATAILAGDALQALAFELLATERALDSNQQVALVHLLSKAAGAEGMVGGQAIDLQSENIELPVAELINMHQRKTGDLIAASVMAGAIIANAGEAASEQLANFGHALGLAFQVKDDILDVVGNTADIGKQQGADEQKQKATFVSTHGLKGAELNLQNLIEQAEASIADLGAKAEPLIHLARFVGNRNH